jgi:uncharacterized coiled-coil DUF342 family protein
LAVTNRSRDVSALSAIVQTEIAAQQAAVFDLRVEREFVEEIRC